MIMHLPGLGIPRVCPVDTEGIWGWPGILSGLYATYMKSDVPCRFVSLAGV